MRIALVNPYSPSLSWFFYAQGMATPPFGLVRLATRLKRHDHDVTVIDGQATYEPHARTVRRVLEHDPALVGIGTTPLLHLYTFMSTSNLPSQLQFARVLRSAGYRGVIVVGGTFASERPRAVLEACPEVDGVLVSDGLTAMDTLARQIDHGRDPEDIPGLVTRSSAAVRQQRGEHAPCLPDFSLLQDWPHHYGVDEDLFLGSGPRRLHPVLPVITSLGCPHQCTFCATPLFFEGRFTQLRDAEVFGWIDRQVKASGVTALSFWDDTLTVSPRRLGTLCDWLASRPWASNWWAFGRTEWLLKNPDLIPRMARAGLKMMWLGVESSDPCHLAQFGRPASFEQARSACQLLLDNGILPTTSFIVGAPDSTRAQLQRDIEHADELYQLGTVNVFTLMIPVPGTPIHTQLAREERLISHDLRLYAGTRAVIRYRDMEPAEVEDIFFEAYRRSILNPRFLGQVGRTGMWEGTPESPDSRAQRLEHGFQAEVAKARSLEAEPLPCSILALGAVS